MNAPAKIASLRSTETRMLHGAARYQIEKKEKEDQLMKAQASAAAAQNDSDSDSLEFDNPCADRSLL